MSEAEAPQPQRLRVELHSHTHASPDSRLSAETIARVNRERGIDVVAVTDHNTMDGAFEMADRLPFPVILGEEIKSTEGDIIGLFLSHEIPRDMSPSDTVAAIREQNGLVLLPHPFDGLRRSALGREAVDSIVEDIDILEVFNGRTLRRRDNDAADRYADDHGLIKSVGSDSHLAAEIGHCCQSMRSWDDPQDFLASLREAELHATLAPAWVHLGSSLHAYAAKVERRLRRLTRA